MIQPIETVYDGYRFRSRLEARWAVFFNTLGIKYEYEKEGYDLDGTWYLPDFYLPEQGCWVEIKGEMPTEEEKTKAELLAYFTNKPVCILWGSCQAPEVNPQEKRYYLRRLAKMFWFKKCSVVFYGKNVIPYPFKDRNNVFYKDRPEHEKNIIDEWNQRTVHIIDDVPLSIMRMLKPYEGLEIILDENTGKITIAISPYWVEDCHEEVDCLAIASLIEKQNLLLEFLAIKKGWRCVFDDGNYLTVGWSECPQCRKIELNSFYSATGCCCRSGNPPYPSKVFDSPRLIAAYVAARQARFEHGMKG